MIEKEHIEIHRRQVKYDLERDLIVTVPTSFSRSTSKRKTNAKRYRVLGATIVHNRYDDPKVTLRSEKVKANGERADTGKLWDFDIPAMSIDDQEAIQGVLAAGLTKYRLDYQSAP